MSLIKRFTEDLETLTLRASYAAWEPTSQLRMRALTAVFEDCGMAAKVYADPTRVTQLLVNAVVQEFMSQRKASVYQVAG